MNKTQSKLEKEEARLREVLVMKGITKYDKEIIIKIRKKVEDRLKYFLLGVKEQKRKENIQLRKLRAEVNIHKENYKLIWEKLEEVEKKKKHCFCGGDKIFRPICSVCQKWRDEIIYPIMKEWILTNQKRKSMEEFFFFVGKDLEKDLDRVGYDIKDCSHTVQKTNNGGKDNE